MAKNHVNFSRLDSFSFIQFASLNLNYQRDMILRQSWSFSFSDVMTKHANLFSYLKCTYWKPIGKFLDFFEEVFKLTNYSVYWKLIQFFNLDMKCINKNDVTWMSLPIMTHIRCNNILSVCRLEANQPENILIKRQEVIPVACRSVWWSNADQSAPVLLIWLPGLVWGERGDMLNVDGAGGGGDQ